MAPAEYIHGSSDVREVERLERQAAFIAPFNLKTFDASPGMKVLDLGTGVGAMAAQLAERYPGIELTGLELRPAQLVHAKARHPVAKYVEGDASRQPFADETFDRVHGSWVLEHVKKPLAVLREVRRVLRPGGYCHFIEVDNASFDTSPAFPEVKQVFEALNTAQKAAGGDPYLGTRLGALLTEAGFSEVRVVENALTGNAKDPAFFKLIIEEFAEIFEGLDEALGADLAPVLTQAAAQVRSLLTLPEGELRYTCYTGQGVK